MIIPALVGIVLYILLFFALWWFIRPDLGGAGGATQKRNFAQLMAQIAGGLALLFGLYFTWRRVEISQRTLETQQDQQVTERFTRAIDQLGATDEEGNKRLEIRLGGIYALERIAQDSPKRDYSTVFEVLSAYVRENTSRSTKENAKPNTEPNTEAEHPLRRRLRRLHTVFISREAEQEVGADQPETESQLNRPPTDVQAILEVLSRLRKLEEYGIVSEELGAAIDLREADLSGANLSGATFFRAYFIRANLSGACLSGAKELTQEQLEQANGDATTALPEGREMPKSWTKGEREQTEEDK